MTRWIGIDLGSSTSVMCAIADGRPVTIPNAEGSASTPSVVAFAAGGGVLVGEPARRQAITNSERTLWPVKRAAGTAGTAQNDGRVLSAQQACGLVLRKLASDASSYLGEEVTGAAIAVPAHFGLAQRRAVREAGHLAGLNACRLISATEAAGLAYHAARSASATIAMLSLGGSAFEVSLVDVGDGVVEVLAAGCDGQLGGDDWDQRVADHLVRQARSGGVVVPSDETTMARLREAAEQAKIELSAVTRAQISVPYIAQSAGGPLHLDTTLTRAEFQAMTADLLDRCRTLFYKVMAEAGPGHTGVDQVVLSGRATRMPAFAALARQLAGGREPDRTVSPDEAVAAGAAWHAGMAAGAVKDLLLIPVMPCSLGVRTRGGVFTPVIGRNDPIPARLSAVFTPAAGSRAESAGVTIEVYQGERALAADNQLVGVLRLPLAAGHGRRIEVTIDVDALGEARASARELPGGAQQTVTLTGSPGQGAGDAGALPGEVELEPVEVGTSCGGSAVT